MKTIFSCDPLAGKRGPERPEIVPSQTRIRKKSCLKKSEK